jgi:hypothetical protein
MIGFSGKLPLATGDAVTIDCAVGIRPPISAGATLIVTGSEVLRGDTKCLGDCSGGAGLDARG